MKTKNKRSLITIISYTVCLVFLVVGSITLLSTFKEKEKVNSSIKADKVIQSKVGPKLTKEVKSKDIPNLNWDEINSISPNIVAWITIPGTKINYPILHGSDNDFYLKHDYNGNRDELGSLFIDYRQLDDFSPLNTFIYGHNVLMDSVDTKFTELNGYLDQDFYSKHKNVIIYTPEKVIHGKIFAAHSDTSDTQSNTKSFNTVEDFNTYKTFMKKVSNIKSDQDVDSVKQLVTLWTCTMKSGVSTNGEPFSKDESRTFVSVAID